MPGPLDGIRVIDVTTVLLGPYGTQILGDMGADVIKVEAPPTGDIARNMGTVRRPGMGGIFLNANRNKRSVALDLKHDSAKEVLRRLVATADVFVHNMRPQAIERLGFDYPAVSAIKPDIVYVGAYGFGQAGPYRAKPAYDDAIQAASGLASLFAMRDETPQTSRRRSRQAGRGDPEPGGGAALLHRSAPARGSSSRCRCSSARVVNLVEHITARRSSADRPARIPAGDHAGAAPLRPGTASVHLAVQRQAMELLHRGGPSGEMEIPASRPTVPGCTPWTSSTPSWPA